MGPFDRNGDVREFGEWPDTFDKQIDILNYHEIASHDDSDFSVELAKFTKGNQ